MRKIGDAVCASTASFAKSLASSRYGCSTPAPLRFCSHARHWLTQPSSAGASSTTSSVCASCDRTASTKGLTPSPHEKQQRDECREAVEEVKIDAPVLQPADPHADGVVQPRDR